MTNGSPDLKTENSPETPKLAAVALQPSVTYAEIKSHQWEKAQSKSPSAFKVRAQLLLEGRTDTVLAASEYLTLRLKVYASGGENVLHAHATEDHSFIVLDGEASFYDGEGLLAKLKKSEGIMLPKGAQYCFNATSQTPLVMLRIGSPNDAARGVEGRVDTQGALTHSSNSPGPGESPPRYADGRFFG